MHVSEIYLFWGCSTLTCLSHKQIVQQTICDVSLFKLAINFSDDLVLIISLHPIALERVGNIQLGSSAVQLWMIQEAVGVGT